MPLRLIHLENAYHSKFFRRYVGSYVVLECHVRDFALVKEVITDICGSKVAFDTLPKFDTCFGTIKIKIKYNNCSLGLVI